MFRSEFQTFDETGDRSASAGRLAALRAQLAAQNLDGFLVPISDKHQNEYRPACEERLAWLTAFTGSAGFAIVLADRAVLFVDGRYTLQVQSQVDTDLFAIENSGKLPPHKWIEQHLPSGSRIGYDPWLLTRERVETFERACSKAGATLVAVAENPIDAIWADRPAEPLAPVVLHPAELAGENVSEKLARIRDELHKGRADALVVSDPQSLAWAFNIRGGDVTHTPLTLGFAIVPADGKPSVYLDGRKLSNSVRAELQSCAEVSEPARLLPDLQALASAGKAIWLDSRSAAASLAREVGDAGGRVISEADPIVALKAVKNETEIAGARAAHLRDGAAFCRFLCWFDREAPSGRLTEIDVVEALESFRRDTGALKEISFPTISGAGPNGAIVHYRVTRGTNRRLGMNELFLLDSGAQYQDGTTDITRTIAVGEPSAEMRDRYTRVLKGHIAIATAIFPDGATGAQLDPFARQHLWLGGLDYDHGTGHGVGSYLSVHEGPASIHSAGLVALKRGMILSNEPGYYKAGEYGIRIENLVLVEPAPGPAGAEKALNRFETLTLAPIDTRVVAPELMTDAEIAWLDGYHARVRDALAGHVDDATREWLVQATRPLASVGTSRPA